MSTTNDCNQTHAHLSRLYDYPFLMSRHVDWCIRLTIADVNSPTTLHYTVVKGDLGSVRLFRRAGVPGPIPDEPGLTPPVLELQHEVPHSSTDTGASAELKAEAHPLEEAVKEYVGYQNSSVHPVSLVIGTRSILVHQSPMAMICPTTRPRWYCR